MANLLFTYYSLQIKFVAILEGKPAKFSKQKKDDKVGNKTVYKKKGTKKDWTKKGRNRFTKKGPNFGLWACKNAFFSPHK